MAEESNRANDKPKTFYKELTDNGWFLLGALLFIAGAVCLGAFGYVYTYPFMKHQDFVESECTVVPAGGEFSRRNRSTVTFFNISLASWSLYPLDDMLTCSGDCGKNCQYTSEFPCIQVIVSYHDAHNTPYKAVLYDESFALIDERCSFNPECERSVSENTDSVKGFADKYGKYGDKYTCYYNIKEKTKVLREKVPVSAVLHSMLWSSLGFVIGVSLMLLGFVQTRNARERRRNTPAPPPTAASGLI